MCDNRVIDLLMSEVKNSNGTVTFLQILRDIIDSSYDKNLEPIERIRKMWYAVFVIRLWREFIESSPRYKLLENFMSSNCYSCIELNAHSLVLTVLHLKKIGMPHLFQPSLYNSQACENTFRQLRSFTTVFSTVVNCSIKEMIGRLDKIQILNDIALNPNFESPRLRKIPTQNPTINESTILPSKEEIVAVIDECKLNALKFAKRIGLIRKNYSPRMTCGVTEYIRSDWYYEPVEKSNKPLPRFGHINLKDFSEEMKGKIISETSAYVQVDCLNKTIIAKKTSLCWFLRSEPCKLSSDRLQRVKAKSGSKKTSRRKPNRNKEDNLKKRARPIKGFKIYK